MLSVRYLQLLILLFTGGIAHAASTALYMQSQKGDYIGAGDKYAYVAPTDTIKLWANSKGVVVSVNPSGPNWSLTFLPPKGASLSNGVYEGAEIYPNNAPGVPGMSISGEGKGCDTVTGRFEIFDLKTDSKGTITSFALQFEQHCQGGPPALFGQILYNAGNLAGPHVSVASASALKGNAGTSDGLVALSLSRPANVPVTVSYATADGSAMAGLDYKAAKGTVTFPRGTTTQYVTIPIIGNRRATTGKSFTMQLSTPVGAPVGAGSATLSIIDPNGPLTVLAMTSQPGTFIGGGFPLLEISDYTSFNKSITTSLAQINLGDPDNWSLYFAPPSGTNLAPGIYANAQRYPFQPANVPGLSVYADVGCNTQGISRSTTFPSHTEIFRRISSRIALATATDCSARFASGKFCSKSRSPMPWSRAATRSLPLRSTRPVPTPFTRFSARSMAPPRPA